MRARECNNTTNIPAFSLVELMVVITIIGILSSVAIPAYRNYILRAEYIEMITHLESFKADIANSLTVKNQFPNTIYNTGINGTTTPSGWKHSYNFHYNTSGSVATGNTAWWCFRLINPAGGNYPTEIGLCMFTDKNTDPYKFSCGLWDTTHAQAAEILERLPDSCKVNINTLVN